MPYRLEIALKENLFDAEGTGICRKAKDYFGILMDSVRTINVITIDGELSNIVINEINYNSADSWDAGDWIEILNAGDYTVNISGWILKDDDDSHEYIIPDGTVIHSHGYLVISRNLDKFQARYPLVEVVDQELNFGQGSGGC